MLKAEFVKAEKKTSETLDGKVIQKILWQLFIQFVLTSKCLELISFSEIKQQFLFSVDSAR